MSSPNAANRTRMLLIIGIVLAGGVSIYLHFELADRRSAAEDAANNSPQARVNAALQEADRATINQEYGAAWTALTEASAALDAALVERPDAPDLLRGRLIVARRLAQVAEHRARSADARPHYEDALARAESLFAARPADSVARADRLGTARGLGDFLTRAEDHAGAARVMRAAAEAVEASASAVPTTGQVQVALGDLWLATARAHAAAKQRESALSAAASAVQRAEATRADEDPITGASRAYTIAAAVVQLAQDLDAQAEQVAFEDDAVRLLEVRQRMQPDDLQINRTLAARYVRVADHRAEAGEFPVAESRHQRAVALRKRLVEQHPADATVRRDLVRGLNQLGGFYSDRDRDDEALATYAEAAEVAKPLDEIGLRTRIIAMGNYAQLLGRVDKTRQARDVAGEVYTLARQRATQRPDDGQAALDAARAGLRRARLLRAPPGADRGAARALAKTVRAEVEALLTAPGSTGKRATAIAGALDELLAELR